MNEIPPIASTGILAPQSTDSRRSPAALAPGDLDDRVEISELAQRLSEADSGSRSRAARVAQIREAILNGTYETPDKIDYTVSRLLEVLNA